VPTYRASMITYPDGGSFAARSQRGFDGYTYGLHGTPTMRTLEAQLTALHNGVRTLADRAMKATPSRAARRMTGFAARGCPSGITQQARPVEKT